MKRRVSGVEFATVWGRVSRWAQPDRNDLVHLLNDMEATKPTEPKKREPRKPKPESGTVTVEDTDAVVRKMNLRGPKSGAPEGGAG